MRENWWLDLADWPPGIVYTPIYLRQGQGGLSHSLNNGQLTFDLLDPAKGAADPGFRPGWAGEGGDLWQFNRPRCRLGGQAL